MRKQAIIQVSHIINIPEDMQNLDDERLLDEIDEFAIDLSKWREECSESYDRNIINNCRHKIQNKTNKTRPRTITK